jgi:dTDP-4-dehydrorhamnose reductase
MKVLLLGERGYLGSYLHNHLDVDTLSSRKLYNNGNRYDYVINCIGKPILEYCETHKEETDYSNRDVLLDIKQHYPDSKIINFSSYYVYDSLDLCTETSNVTKKYNYTRQKLEGEEMIENGVSFRVGKFFGHPEIEKQKKITEHILTHDELTLDNVIFNPTSLEQVLTVLRWELLNNKLYGVYNLANEGVTSHYNYGSFINQILGANKKITRIDKVDRQFTNYGKFTMSCDKIKQYMPLTDWKIDMIAYLEKYYNLNNNG